MRPSVWPRSSYGCTEPPPGVGHRSRTLLLLTLLSWPALAAGRPQSRLDRTLTARAGQPGVSRVIVRSTGAADVTARIRAAGGRIGPASGPCGWLRGRGPQQCARGTGRRPRRCRRAPGPPDRRAAGAGAGIGAGNASAPSSTSALDFTGAGVGVAVIDSGLTRGMTIWRASMPAGRWSASAWWALPTSRARPVKSPTPTATARTWRASSPGSGHDSDGEYAGVAPGAHLLVLKVLDGQGRGFVSDVIRAIDFAVTNRSRFNLRVINLSIGAPVLESDETDPLTLAARRAVEAGVVVVAAAGNFGKNVNERDSVRRRHRAGQRAVGAHGWRLQPHGHARSGRRSRRRLQLARSDGV